MKQQPRTANCCWRSDPFCERRRSCDGRKPEMLDFARQCKLLLDWWPGKQCLDVSARPWLTVCCLLADPMLAWLRGKRGPAAALTYSLQRLSGNRKRSGPRAQENSADTAAGFAGDLVVGWRVRSLAKALLKSRRAGFDIMLVADVSGSMLTKDFTIGGQEETRVRRIRESHTQIHRRTNPMIARYYRICRSSVFVSPMDAGSRLAFFFCKSSIALRIGLVEDGTAIARHGSGRQSTNDKHSKAVRCPVDPRQRNNSGKIPQNTAAEAVKALKIHFYAIGAGIMVLRLRDLYPERAC